jgi:hypothetical protein
VTAGSKTFGMTLSVTAVPPPSSSITEDFESGGWTGGTGWSNAWSPTGNAANITGSGPQAGSRHAEIRSNGSLTRTFSLTGYASATLTFWAKANSWECSGGFACYFGGGTRDGASVQVSTNGSTWTTVATFTDGFDNNTYQQRQVNLNQWAGQGTVYLRILGQMNATEDYFYVDSITIQ